MPGPREFTINSKILGKDSISAGFALKAEWAQWDLVMNNHMIINSINTFFPQYIEESLIFQIDSPWIKVLGGIEM